MLTDAIINVNGDSVQALDIMLLMTVITLLPTLVVMMTSFTRYVVSLSFLRGRHPPVIPCRFPAVRIAPIIQTRDIAKEGEVHDQGGIVLACGNDHITPNLHVPYRIPCYQTSCATAVTGNDLYIRLIAKFLITYKYQHRLGILFPVEDFIRLGPDSVACGFPCDMIH